MTSPHRLRIGSTAPEFSLIDQNGHEMSLKDLAGHWTVIYFYPKDDTPGCTTEACEFTDLVGSFEKYKARVLGISPDLPDSHRKFIAQKSLKLTLLSDPEHRMMSSYGVWGKKKQFGREQVGVIRSTFLVDPAGKIAHAWSNVKAAGHAEKVQQILGKLASQS